MQIRLKSSGELGSKAKKGAGKRKIENGKATKLNMH